MKAVDTNIIVRFVLANHPQQDSPEQYMAAAQTLKKGGVFIPDTVILESLWVLSRLYKLTRAECVTELRDICSLKEVTLENPQRIANALTWYELGMDFADALHLAGSAENQCATMTTFDADFVKRAKGRTACKVSAPA